MPSKWGQVRLDVERDAVITDPAPDAHPDGGDLVLAARTAIDPDADPALAPRAGDVEARQRRDQPVLQIAHEAA